MIRRYASLATFVLGWLVGLGLLGAPASAQAEDESDFQIWVAGLGTYDLRPSAPIPSLWLDVHARRSDAGTVHILRPGFGFAPTSWMSFWVGYAWIPTSNDATGDTVNEHRFWNQWIFAHQTKFRLALQSRTRTEYRFNEAGDDVGLRLRQFVRVGWQPSSRVPLGVAVWDEVFFGLNRPDWGALRGFDQNRFFVGPFLQATSWARLEAGYLSLVLRRPDGDLLGHVLAVNLFVNLKRDPGEEP